jgi:DNA-binding MarR family transcriptional regulator
MPGTRDDVPELNEIIHQPVRLRVMSALTSLKPDEEIDFSSLAKMLEVTDGNLGAHLLKLEEAGYTMVKKTFVERKPRTFLKASNKGRAAFEDHVAALRQILGKDGGK